MRSVSIALILWLSCGFSFAQDITVAAAADLQYAFQDVAVRFEKASGHHVKLIFGSSGNFFAQIQNGAPFDLFFSADSDYPRKLETAGLVEPGTFYAYATGKIVLWAPMESKLDLAQGLSVLKAPAVKKIAIANPDHAPYGRAAVAALHHENLYDAVSGKFVLGENIAQTAEFAATGNAEVGIIALSLALSPAMQSNGRYVEIPADDYPAIQQAAVILKSSGQKDVSRQFLDFVKTPVMVDLLHSYGFSNPASLNALR